ncbi:MAG: tungsten-containing aldehyde ferredoxin oxidoreductase cofactor modifying protein [Candidatus Methanoperedens nitroreducens]|uniref:Tungsten-containing aldehyde ferredoxin oxidoreductase cofactor modifying protein n=1 Tax=Candidatus Methanoperedens nitratireducens TaxID=1392998 RepID=A0A0P7ZBL5_9EURY|nr:radical SAM protein [Candidatus Methanoperedens sp. BLZ2]KAB2946560.1 MAG: radical SAM protein [Candidatus Methanoperedens sp.]KPQ41968.1 MAG: tungsten-containing aldehyde ferredoxin oxidoreductase cofactor modifying protein [Candidatus Methanoperedens sp. BLZ1]MBZ0175062.1 radical SAM protein [Candidatus Methanoperedens nitroreducens]
MDLLYTKMKIFHFPEKIESLPKNTENIMAPIHIRIKPTNVCNHNCRYCAYRTDNLQLGADMVKKDYIPKQKMMEIIDDIEEMGVKAITFSGGGDPFRYPYLLETVKKLSRTPIKFAALTNGSGLTGEIAEIFAHHGTWVRISMDGWDDESYSKYRGVQHGEFTKVLKNIENFKQIKGKCLLGVVVIIDKMNYSHIYDIIKKLKDIGVDSVKIAPCVVSNSAKENNKYHEAIFAVVKEQINKASSELKDDNFEIFDSYHEQLETFEKKHTWCPYLQILHVIGADQNVYSCQDKAYNFESGLIGSIKDIRYKDFWFANKDKFFKINPSIHCLHHCVANEKNKIVLEYLEADKEHIGFV